MKTQILISALTLLTLGSTAWASAAHSPQDTGKFICSAQGDVVGYRPGRGESRRFEWGTVESQLPDASTAAITSCQNSVRPLNNCVVQSCYRIDSSGQLTPVNKN